jgi:hypothetical protein
VPTTSGPYARVRNPIAWASFISDVGFGILVAAWVPLAVYALLYWGITARRILRYEEPMLRRRCGEAYDDYRREVPPFIPGIRGIDGPRWPGFSFRRLWENAEVSRLLAALSLVALYRLVWAWRAGGPEGNADFWLSLGLGLGLGIASLVLQAMEYRPHVWRRRIQRWLKGEPGGHVPNSPGTCTEFHHGGDSPCTGTSGMDPTRET